jgi:hypothetical protein
MDEPDATGWIGQNLLEPGACHYFSGLPMPYGLAFFETGHSVAGAKPPSAFPIDGDRVDRIIG